MRLGKRGVECVGEGKLVRTAAWVSLAIGKRSSTKCEQCGAEADSSQDL